MQTRGEKHRLFLSRVTRHSRSTCTCLVLVQASKISGTWSEIPRFIRQKMYFLALFASSCSSSSSQLNRSNKSVFLLQSCFTERVNDCVDDAFFVQLSKATLVEDTPFCTTQSLNQHFP